MDCDGKRQRRFSCKHGTREEGGKAGVEQEITEGTEMEGQHKPLTDSGNAISILFLRYLRFLLFNPKPNSDSARSPWPTCWLSVCRARAVPGRKT